MVHLLKQLVIGEHLPIYPEDRYYQEDVDFLGSIEIKVE